MDGEVIRSICVKREKNSKRTSRLIRALEWTGSGGKDKEITVTQKYLTHS